MNLRVLYIFTVSKRVIKPKSLMFTVTSNKLHNCGSLRWIAGARREKVIGDIGRVYEREGSARKGGSAHER